MTLQEKIKKLRKQHKLSQAELAEKIGSHTGHISRLENGRYQPSIELLKKMAQALEVTTDYLLDESDDNLTTVNIQDKNLAERIRMLDSLEQDERDALLKIIDALLTKKKVVDLVTGNAKSTG